jgi:hypothetical protein
VIIWRRDAFLTGHVESGLPECLFRSALSSEAYYHSQARSGPQAIRMTHSKWAKLDRLAPFEEQARLSVPSRSHLGGEISLLEFRLEFQ